MKLIAKLNKEERHKALMELSYDDLKLYLNKLQNKKSLYYENIFNEDMNLINKFRPNNYSNKRMIGGNIIPSVISLALNQTLPICPSVISECDARYKVLELTLATLRKQNLCTIDKDQFWKIMIMDFIEFLLCCTKFYSDDRFAELRLNIIVPITKLLVINPDYKKVALDYIDILIKNDPSLYINEFAILEERRFETKKYYGTLSNDYIDISNKIEELITKYSFGVIFMNKILYKLQHLESP